MAGYFAVLFSDLERHSLSWSRVPRDRMAAIVADYRYLAESLASQYGCGYMEWAGDGHMFLFENADGAVRFGLRLIGQWRNAQAGPTRHAGHPPLSLRLGCHFAECVPMEGGRGWIGRGNSVAKRVESEAGTDCLFVTESILDLIDLPFYQVEEAGTYALKGDAVRQRSLYRVVTFDQSGFDAKPVEEFTAGQWFLKGVALIGTSRENSPEEADCYRRALSRQPDFAEAHTNLAVVLSAMGQQAEAAEHYKDALRRRTAYPEAHFNYATLLAAGGDLTGATEHYREALTLRPDYVDAHHGYANLLKDARDLAGAGRHYAEALRARPDFPEVHNNYAILLESLGDPAGAHQHYQEALRLRPDYPEAHYNCALLLESLGQTVRAEDHYRQALRSRPDYPEARNNLAVLLHMRGDLAEAEVHFREAVRLRPDDPEVRHNYALLLKVKGGTEA